MSVKGALTPVRASLSGLMTRYRLVLVHLWQLAFACLVLGGAA